MPINLQGSGNIATGWGQEPQLSAPNIGFLVGDILRNRLGQQQLQQQQLADAVKQQREQQANTAYINAAQYTGMLPQGDYSGLTAAGAANLAAQIQGQIPDKQADKLKTAMAGYYDYLAGGGVGGRRGGGASAQNIVPLPDENGDPQLGPDGNPIMVSRTSKIYQDALRNVYPNLSTPFSPNQSTTLAAKAGVPAEDFLDPSRHQGMQVVPSVTYTAPGTQPKTMPQEILPLSPDQDPSEATHIRINPSAPNPVTGTTNPVDVPLLMFNRIKRGLAGATGPSVSQNDVDQATQAQGLQPGASAPPPAASPPPYSQSIPTPTPPPGGPPAAAPPSSGRPNASTGAPINMPQRGDVVGGYRFLGGDPNVRSNWVPVNS